MANDVFYKDNQGNYAFDTKVLEVAFKEARKIYKERGFMREMGQGITLPLQPLIWLGLG